MARLRADAVSLAYGSAEPVVHDLSVRLPDGTVTAIVGPNGCGKSTLLRSLARLMRPRTGAVLLDGEAIHRRSTKEVARQLGLLAQRPSAPERITVGDLARRGRYPHQSLLQPLTARDRLAVENALALAGMGAQRDRAIDDLSGGQRQRAWIAMALAQETPILLLDEPTTYLDIAHQQETLSLISRLNRREGRTVALVLHDVNSAAQIGDHVVAMRDGRIAAEGPPRDVLTPEGLERIFGVPFDAVRHPQSRASVSVPRGKPPRCDGPPPRADGPAPRAEALSLGYGGGAVVAEATVSIPPGRVTAIVGPNACGKSTLLRGLARLLKPMAGAALLGALPVGAGSHRAFARRLSMLAQRTETPAGYRVEDLVALGRHPYQSWRRQWSGEDEDAVSRAMAATGVSELRWREVDSLSGGQQQRAWLAMALAQQTPVLLLDEPTTFLDVAHQVEMLDLIGRMNREDGRTVVMVLHDLGQACRYADHLVAMKDGRIAARGSPRETVTPAFVRAIFDLDCPIVRDPVGGRPLVLPPALRADRADGGVGAGSPPGARPPLQPTAVGG